jgi:hypothetical protein
MRGWENNQTGRFIGDNSGKAFIVWKASWMVGAAVDRQRGRRLKFSSHDPSVMSVSTPVSAIDPSLIASSGAKPSRAEFFQTKTERI